MPEPLLARPTEIYRPFAPEELAVLRGFSDGVRRLAAMSFFEKVPTTASMTFDTEGLRSTMEEPDDEAVTAAIARFRNLYNSSEPHSFSKRSRCSSGAFTSAVGLCATLPSRSSTATARPRRTRSKRASVGAAHVRAPAAPRSPPTGPGHDDPAIALQLVEPLVELQAADADALTQLARGRDGRPASAAAAAASKPSSRR
jgi:hypothetical protein